MKIRSLAWCVLLPLFSTLSPGMSSAATLALVGGRVIQGTGAPAIEDGVVVIVDGRIASVGPRSRIAIPDGAATINVAGKTVMPGMVQGNGHVSFAGQGDHGRYWTTRLGDLYGIGARNLIDSLQQGVTTIRDTMGPVDTLVRLRQDVNTGALAGSRLFTCGTILNYGGMPPLLDELDKPGSGATHEQVEAARRALNLAVGSAAEGRALVDAYAGRGVDFIKVSAVSGTGEYPPTMPQATLAAVIDQAHRRGLRTTTHAIGAQSIIASMDAGSDAIEHPAIAGSFDLPADQQLIPQELAQRMARQHVYAVSLIVAFEVYVTYLKHPEWLDDPQRMGQVPEGMLDEGKAYVAGELAHGAGLDRWERLYAVTRENMTRLIKAGVPIAMGTDSGTRLNYHQSANHVREMEIFVELGMTPLEAITSATLRGAELLGREKDLGSLEAGKIADVIVIDGNPLENMAALRHVSMVFKDGVRYR
jgi:imidazolonepropionase-like amidohydrolase